MSKKLLSSLIGETSLIGNDVEICGVTCDSRVVGKGFLFAALKGQKSDGRDFIEQAIKQGAVAVLTDGRPITDLQENITLIQTDQPRQLYAQIAAKLYEHQPEHIVAVTGTNGKTSVASFTAQIWQDLGKLSGSLGTLGMRSDVFQKDGAMTTPDAAVLFETLAQAGQAGVTHLAMEASSHGLDQGRLNGVHLSAAGFTNLTRDHLDYHGTMEAYACAKSLLFSGALARGGVAVINADSDYAQVMINAAKERDAEILLYGQNEDCPIHLKSRQITPAGQKLSLNIFGQDFDVELPLIGAFQAENALCALGLVLSNKAMRKTHLPQAVQALESLKPVDGRLERIDGHPKGAAVFVDYAHTADALQQVISAVRPHTKGRVITLFGCGGDRDRGKRPAMGSVAYESADIGILTDDNPRSEDPAQIRGDVLAALPDDQKKVIEVAGRENAIEKTLSLAESGDIVLITGKGHEQGQTIKGETLPFDDRVVAKAKLAELAKKMERKSG